MNAKKIARQLELIKYFTLRKSAIYFNINADIDQDKEIENEYVQLSGNYSFNFESIIVDYAKSYSSNLKQKTLQLYFYKKPNPNSSNFELIDDPNGLMTPAIINDYIKDGQNYKRYIFPSHYNHQTYSEWYSDNSMDIDKRATRSYSMNIIVDEFSIPAFNSFLNESSSQWKIRFNTAKDQAILGNFYWLSLYDPRIYQYELSFEDRKKILDYMVYSLYWAIIFPGHEGINGVDEYELFVSLITNLSEADGTAFYKYMFTIDEVTNKTNLEIYEDKIPKEIFDTLLLTLTKHFYSTKSIIEFKNGFRERLLYPIGLYEKLGSNLTFDLDEEHYANPGPYILGVKYKINDNKLKIKVNSALKYRENARLHRLEYKRFEIIGKGEELKYDDTIYITSFLSNQKLKGLDIPYGCVIPIPAFALSWIINKNEEKENIIDLIEKGVAITGLVIPITEIIEGVNVIYNFIGIGFSLFGNALNAGVKDQVEKYDKSKSTPDHPYTRGSDFLNTYYLLSAIYGGINLSKTIAEGGTFKEKIKILFEFETLLGMKGVLGDINSYLEQNGENLDGLTNINNKMNQLTVDYNNYKYLKNINL